MWTVRTHTKKDYEQLNKQGKGRPKGLTLELEKEITATLSKMREGDGAEIELMDGADRKVVKSYWKFVSEKIKKHIVFERGTNGTLKFQVRELTAEEQARVDRLLRRDQAE